MHESAADGEAVEVEPLSDSPEGNLKKGTVPLRIEEQSPFSRVRVRRHIEMLILAAIVVLLAYALQVLPNGRVAFRFLPGFPLPETCASRAWFGVSCPGCGLTRSIVRLARGDLQESLNLHRLGWLMALAILYQFPYRLYCLAYGGCSSSVLFIYRCFGYLLIFLLIANWARNTFLPTL